MSELTDIIDGLTSELERLRAALDWIGLQTCEAKIGLKVEEALMRGDFAAAQKHRGVARSQDSHCTDNDCECHFTAAGFPLSASPK